MRPAGPATRGSSWSRPPREGRLDREPCRIQEGTQVGEVGDRAVARGPRLGLATG